MSAAAARLIGYRGKRFLDLAIAIPALFVFAPVMAIVAILVAARTGRPVIFSQPRPGQGRETFHIYKFRTMRDAYDSEGRPLPDRERLTPLGRVLRATSLDELPELLNVIKGEMSLVGPRPLLVNYLPYYSETEMLRFSARPGITGWAQVNGRNDLPWDARLASDVWYVEHCSLRLDLCILWRTTGKVLRREAVHVDTAAKEPDLSVERAERRRMHVTGRRAERQ